MSIQYFEYLTSDVIQIQLPEEMTATRMTEKTTKELVKVLRQEEIQKVVIVFEMTTYINSSGLGVLGRWLREITDQGAEPILASFRSMVVLKILGQMGLLQKVKVYESVDTLLEDLDVDAPATSEASLEVLDESVAEDSGGEPEAPDAEPTDAAEAEDAPEEEGSGEESSEESPDKPTA